MASISRSRSGLALELQLAQHVEDLASERCPRLFELRQERQVDVAFASFVGDEIPEMADLRLPDPVNAPEALLDSVRIPRQVVVDHQMRALEVDPFPSGVGREKDLDFGVMAEELLGLQALLATHPPVDDDDSVRTSKQCGDAPL